MVQSIKGLPSKHRPMFTPQNPWVKLVMVAHTCNPGAAGDRQNPGAHWLVGLVNSGGSRPVEDSVSKTPKTDVTRTAAPEVVLYIYTSCTTMQAHLHTCEETHTDTHTYTYTYAHTHTYTPSSRVGFMLLLVYSYRSLFVL